MKSEAEKCVSIVMRTLEANDNIFSYDCVAIDRLLQISNMLLPEDYVACLRLGVPREGWIGEHRYLRLDDPLESQNDEACRALQESYGSDLKARIFYFASDGGGSYIYFILRSGQNVPGVIKLYVPEGEVNAEYETFEQFILSENSALDD